MVESSHDKIKDYEQERAARAIDGAMKFLEKSKKDLEIK